MSRCKIQAQRLSIAGSRLRASELKQRFFVHTQQDAILCPGLMVQPCLHTSLPINNHVTYNCAAGVARGSLFYPPFAHFTSIEKDNPSPKSVKIDG